MSGVDVLAVMQPSIKQMVVRSQCGHHTLLRCASEGRAPERPRFVSEARGFATARGTLLSWGAIERNGEGWTLTERGTELLAALNQRAALARVQGEG
jgi:hypothetical protein